MARQKKNRKLQVPKAIETARNFLIKKMAVIIIAVVFILLTWVLTSAFLQRSDYFRVTSIEARGAAETSLMSIRSDLLRHYKDSNIFKVDLKYIADSLEPKYPDAKYIIVKRMLPDKLLVDMKFRKPVAILGNGQNYPVDGEGVILVNMDPSKLKDLPVINGVDIKLVGRPHKRNQSKSLESAIKLADTIKKSGFLKKYRVRLIDASDIKNLSFYLGEGGPAVIIGYENFEDRLDLLRDILKRERLILDKINYIDIRFKDIAISPK